jgi:TRAP-type C4-dicarboxylate transport system permease small subunit
MMHGPLPDLDPTRDAVTSTGLVAASERFLGLCHQIIVVVAAVAMIAACAILSYSVLGRALFQSPNYWQDEAAVFLLVGVTFMSSVWVVDVASFAFCAFFAWKSWTLAHEAWTDGQVSNSMWSPPLAIPYVLMAFGMTLLCAQILLQIVASSGRAGRR